MQLISFLFPLVSCLGTEDSFHLYGDLQRIRPARIFGSLSIRSGHFQSERQIALQQIYKADFENLAKFWKKPQVT